MHFKKFLKDFKLKIENKGEELVITASGSKEAVAKLEKKLNAIHELCGDCCCEEGGCC